MCYGRVQKNVNQYMRNLEDKPASFISKLCNILRSKENAKTIYWDSEQGGIRILNQKKLEEHILPRYYRHHRYASFVRQLNMYDFHKVYLGDHKSIFLHADFNPKDKENIHLIRRKVSLSSQCSPDPSLPIAPASDIQNRIPFDPQGFEDQAQDECEKCDNVELNREVLQNFMKSSRRLIRRCSMKVSDKQIQMEASEEQMIDQIKAMMLPDPNNAKLGAKIKELKHSKRYRKYFKRPNFMERVYGSLGLENDFQSEGLSQLSIEQDLPTFKSIALRSLKMVQTEQVMRRRETLGLLFM